MMLKKEVAFAQEFHVPSLLERHMRSHTQVLTPLKHFKTLSVI
jgi:hypothetical protein